MQRSPNINLKLSKIDFFVPTMSLVNGIAVKVLKFSQIQNWFSGQEFTKCLSESQKCDTLIRLLLQKQPDMVLPYLS